MCDPETMAAQLGHLLAVASSPFVSIGVIPTGPCRPHLPVEDFSLFDEAEVAVEQIEGPTRPVDRAVAGHARLGRAGAGRAGRCPAGRSVRGVGEPEHGAAAGRAPTSRASRPGRRPAPAPGASGGRPAVCGCRSCRVRGFRGRKWVGVFRTLWRWRVRTGIRAWIGPVRWGVLGGDGGICWWGGR
ncbi:Scr1 family TA system antitoxin-like transcriptional regulator [Kitasatospora sp. NPDC001540]|uniref:Scr1 family TA system antitoxin-like transcriptional regulator n=1 Tax=Kitasatospora sp. NPDC001540 TaxID=3364014 RepID=UPI0036C87B61